MHASICHLIFHCTFPQQSGLRNAECPFSGFAFLHLIMGNFDLILTVTEVEENNFSVFFLQRT